MKTFKEYSEQIRTFASYPLRGNNLMYPAMGLSGEAGETVDKIKKHSRNKDIAILRGSDLTDEERIAIVRELGDVLWYIDALGYELGVSLEEIAQGNVEKLGDRRSRGVIKSQGDDR